MCVRERERERQRELLERPSDNDLCEECERKKELMKKTMN